MILITGATGNLGKSAIDFLLKEKQPEEVAALVRDPGKAEALASRGVELRKGDYENYSSLQGAFEGVDQLLFISTSVTGEDRNRQHSNVVKAAREAGIKHIYYTSIVNPQPNAVFSATPGHYLTEQQIRESGISYTFFRNNLYMDLLPLLIGNAADTGELYFAAGDQRAGFVLREDIAEAIARVMLDGNFENREFTISSSQPYSFYDVAVAISKAADKPVKYIPISTRDMESAMQQAGVPAAVIDITTNMADAMQKGEFDQIDPAMETLLDRKPVELETFIKQFYAM